jgi:hypothetical protein
VPSTNLTSGIPGGPPKSPRRCYIFEEIFEEGAFEDDFFQSHEIALTEQTNGKFFYGWIHRNENGVFASTPAGMEKACACLMPGCLPAC